MMYNKLPQRILERVKHEVEMKEISITVNGKCQCLALTVTQKPEVFHAECMELGRCRSMAAQQCKK